MTSNPSRPTPEWPASGPAPSEPLDALPAAGDGFQAPQERFYTGPQDRVTGGSAAARWPTKRAPWPGPGVAQAAEAPESATGQPAAAAAAQATAEPVAPPGAPAPAEGDERLAMLSYLGVPFLGPLVPLAILLFKGRSSAYMRRHAAQALDLAITTLLYSICALILGTMLALDNIVLALIVVVPLAVALWLVTLAYVIVAGSSANRGDYYPIPSWICASLTHKNDIPEREAPGDSPSSVR
jgi:uncharacterized Tic20 family protein